MIDPQSARARHAGFPADFVPFDPAEIEQSIPARFERTVAAHPDRLAVKAGPRAWTYAELNAAANRIAHVLLERAGPAAEPIPLLLEHGAPFIPALLGVLKAGKFYVPLDPALPPARLAEMLADLGARRLLASPPTAALAARLAAPGIDAIDVDALPGRPSDANPALAIAPDARAYVIYTSGSTGAPKGVVTDHRVALHYTMNYTNSVRYGKHDRISWINALTANAAVSDIYPALLNGGAVFPFAVGEEGIDRLAAWLAEEAITSYGSVPVIFRRLAAVVAHREQLPHLRLIRLGGDRLLRSDVELFRRRFSPRCLLRNGMGAAEVLLVRQLFIDAETEVTSHVVPVGYALPDVDVVVLDEAHRPVAAGETGEIGVKSRYLAQGYWRRPDLTAERFLEPATPGGERVYLTGDVGRLLPDGCLVHLGRTDFQVKIRGKLVAPVEVENALLDLPAVKEAVVTAHEDGAGEPRLVAYVVAAQAPAPPASELRRALAERLPAALIPSAFVALDALPLTANSKVDRRALPAPPAGRPETPFVAPRTPTEQALAAIWAEVLQVERIGVDDDFLDLGGDSLLATRVVALVTRRFATDVPLRALLGAPTVAQMAALVPDPAAARPAPPDRAPRARLPLSENPLEVQLAAIWKARLGRRPIGRRDRFFDVGGAPDDVERLLADVEQAVGERVPLDAFLEEPTVEHLAAVIVGRRRESFQSLVTTVQPGATRTPFFLFHGDYRGGGFFCRPLARALGADLPVHALHPHGLNGRPVPRTIEAMAADFLPVIRRLQPHGPYVLGGYCNGGVVAYEAAQRLRAAGEEVRLLVLLDAAISGPRHRGAYAAVASLGAWRGWSPERREDAFLRYREWRDHVGNRARALRRRARRLGAAGLRGVLRAAAARLPGRAAPAPRPGVTTPPAAAVPGAPDLDNDYRRALWRYMPHRFPGPVVAFVAAEGLRETLGPDLGWRAVAPTLTLYDVPGDHGEFLTHHQSTFAAPLRRHLDDATR